MKLTICLALWLLIGNWLLVPLVSSTRTFTDGFYIGLIVAVLVMVFYAFTPQSR